MNIDKILISLLGVALLVIFSDSSMANSWEHKSGCFETTMVPLPELFFSNHKVVWDENERAGLLFNKWNVPTIIDISSMKGEFEKFLRSLNIKGYIDTTSTLTAEKPWMTGDMQATLRGDLIIKNYGLLEQFLTPGETTVSVPVEINGQRYLLADFSISDSIIPIIQSSECYVSNSSFKDLRGN